MFGEPRDVPSTLMGFLRHFVFVFKWRDEKINGFDGLMVSSPGPGVRQCLEPFAVIVML